MTTKARGKPKLSKQDRAILNALPEDYRRALLYIHTAQSEESAQHGQQPPSLAQILQGFIFDWLKDARDRDEAAHTAFEILNTRVKATKSGIRYVMSRGFRELLKDAAKTHRENHYTPEDSREALRTVVALWLPKSASGEPTRFFDAGELNAFISVNRPLIDAALEGLVDNE